MPDRRTDLPALPLKERQVLELVFREQGLSRKELAERLDENATSLTRIAGRLMEAGLLSEAVDRSGAVGQPRRPLSIAPRRFFSAGVTFALKTIELVIIDLAGEVVASLQHPLERPSPGHAAAEAGVMLEQALALAGLERSALVGIGISMPGNFGRGAGGMRMHNLFTEFDDAELYGFFVKELGEDVVFENNGSCTALGEYFYAGGHQHRVFLKLHIGHGLATGTIIDGRLFRGAHGNAGVAGVLFPYGKPRPTGQDLTETLAAAGFGDRDISDLDSLPEAAAPVVAAWEDRAARQLGEAVRVATGFFDPEIIVIGGQLPLAITERLVARIDTSALPGPSRALPVAPVRCTRLGPLAGTIGAACVPFFTRFFPGSLEYSRP